VPIKILVVEDDADSRDFLVTLLRLEGYSVSIAGDGLEAIKQVETDRPDLILSDIAMPNLDGIDMVKQLRSSPDYKAIPIVMLSAFGSGNLINAINAGANQAMRKPINPDLLLKNVSEWLAETLRPTGRPRVRLAE
jgi:CheY-like chemotaxis protein